MKSITKAAAILTVAATAAWGQSPSPSMATPGAQSNPRAVMATSNAIGLAQSQQARAAIHQRVEDMGSTLAKMHALLKQMQEKTKETGSKDSMSKANLEMWGLMLQDLDKQYEQMRVAARSRDEMEARREALYKQAEAKAAAEAQGVRAPGFGRVPVKGSEQGSSPSAPAPAAQPAQNPAAPASSSPQK